MSIKNIVNSMVAGVVVSLLLVGCGSSNSDSGKIVDKKQDDISKEASNHAPLNSNYKSDEKDIIKESSKHAPIDAETSSSSNKDIAKPIPASKQVDIVK
jgi:hypothetical protein